VLRNGTETTPTPAGTLAIAAMITSRLWVALVGKLRNVSARPWPARARVTTTASRAAHRLTSLDFMDMSQPPVNMKDNTSMCLVTYTHPSEYTPTHES